MKTRYALTHVLFCAPSSYTDSASSLIPICVYRTIDDMDVRMGFANFDTRGKVLGKEGAPSL